MDVLMKNITSQLFGISSFNSLEYLVVSIQ